MIKVIQHLKDRLAGKVPAGSKRSNEWPKVRAAHLAARPACELCGGTKKTEVHHMRPFHIDPSLELNPGNLITLCEAKKDGINCHLFVGHLGNFKSFNVAVMADAHEWSAKILGRPKDGGA